jgi:hypothetical protein
MAMGGWVVLLLALLVAVPILWLLESSG